MACVFEWCEAVQNGVRCLNGAGLCRMACVLEWCKAVQNGRDCLNCAVRQSDKLTDFVEIEKVACQLSKEVN